VALSVELTCFNLAVNTIGLTIIFSLVSKILRLASMSGEYLNDVTLTILFVSTNLYFLYRAAGTFYSQRGILQLVRVAIGIVGLFLALEVYKLILFFLTMWTV